jgi:uncharacterized protein YprB with RNaseH-like and TPR domain
LITEALQHCAGIGPVRLATLHSTGVRTWADVLECHERIPASWRPQLVAECRRCLTALKTDDLGYFLDCFAPQDRWRILDHYFEQATFFDIETEGLHYDAPITTIVCWHQGRLWTFIEHENLDDFLQLLESVTLLVSFNGSTFDVPRVLDAFHIPTLGCGHLDLRWSCYHQGYRGGLKEITGQLEIERPSDLQAADGQMAVELWNAWQTDQDRGAREQLIRYCAADVLLLVALAGRLTGRSDEGADELWRLLPAATPARINRIGPEETARRVQGAMFGSGSPRQLRALRRRDRLSPPPGSHPRTS